MTQLSKHQYLQVCARRSYFVWRNIRLPNDWDDMSDIQRESYVKQTCFEDWQESNSSDYYEAGKAECRWWQNAKADDLDDWEVEGTPLLELVTQPKSWLILSGLYARNAEAFWEEDDAEE